ncbi:hypothetical protein HAX54_010852, partial [Datura stramonium]|nr:hypothetical protein [Datura stramonium]
SGRINIKGTASTQEVTPITLLARRTLVDPPQRLMTYSTESKKEAADYSCAIEIRSSSSISSPYLADLDSLIAYLLVAGDPVPTR